MSLAITAGSSVAVTGGVLVILTTLTAMSVGAWRFLRKISHFIDDVNGESARPGVAARPGVMEQVAALTAAQDDMRVRQEEIASVAQTAADDASAIRSELTPNGGSSTKDAVHAAVRAATAAEEAAARTEDLMRRHMENGLEIMAVGVHNDGQLYRALDEHGIEVTGIRDYPDVDTGE
jgi:hypothetical protein